MANPFTYYAKPQTAREWQSNANHATYARMEAKDTLRAYDRAGLAAPVNVISDAHSARWVENEARHAAQRARKAIGR